MILLGIRIPIFPLPKDPIPIIPTPIVQINSKDRILEGTQIAAILESKFDQLALTNQQYKQIDQLMVEIQTGSRSIEDAILELRGGSYFLDAVGIIAFLSFFYWYNGFHNANAFQQAYPLPHQDPIGWSQGKYKPHTQNGRGTSNPETNFRFFC